jgi:hypothetical protein
MDDVVRRVRGEFLEMPGLMLTPRQLQRLCGLDPTVTQRVLDTLVDTQFLYVSRTGRYARYQGTGPRSRPIPGSVLATAHLAEL